MTVSLSHMWKLLVLAASVLAVLITLDLTVIDQSVNTDEATDHTDIALYRNRAQLILKGGLIYRDIEIHTPPLINYLLVPPVAVGGAALAFEVYFSLFIILTVLSINNLLTHINKKYAFFAAFVFLLLPTTLSTPTLCRQDESIIVFFFMLPLLLLYAGIRKGWYSGFSALGIWMKMHSVFLIPPFLFRQSIRYAFRHIMIIIAVSAAVVFPFIAMAYNEFVWHLRFYLLGEGEELQGISLWRILDSQGIGVPSIVLIGVLIATLLSIYYFLRKESLWKCVLLSLIAYFVFYPKIHYEYFLIFFAVSVPFCIENRRCTIILFVISGLTSITLLIEQRYLDWKTIDYNYDFAVSIALLSMIIVDMLLLYIAWWSMSNNTWLDKSEVEQELFCP